MTPDIWIGPWGNLITNPRFRAVCFDLDKQGIIPDKLGMPDTYGFFAQSYPLGSAVIQIVDFHPHYCRKNDNWTMRSGAIAANAWFLEYLREMIDSVKTYRVAVRYKKHGKSIHNPNDIAWIYQSGPILEQNLSIGPHFLIQDTLYQGISVRDEAQVPYVAFDEHTGYKVPSEWVTDDGRWTDQTKEYLVRESILAQDHTMLI